MMEGGKTIIRSIRIFASQINGRLGWLGFRRPPPPLRKLLILPYLGYGTHSDLYMTGRVVLDKGVTIAKDNDNIWTNLVNMYKRYTNHAVPHALIHASFGELQQEVLTDRDGYFELHFSLATPIESNDIWFDINLELVDYPGKVSDAESNADMQAIGKVLIPSPNAQFGVISDIDDTVLRTDILNVFSMVSNTFLNNARTRLPFEGVAAFYDALRHGVIESTYNPIFYVSGSAWNLYDFIADFFLIRGIPTGPLFLVDFSIHKGKIVSPTIHEHKMGMIGKLLETYPHLRFILIGDSGQRDPEIYREVVQTNPGRIQAIYIRDVTKQKRDLQVRAIVAEVRALGTEMFYVEDTLEASNYALEQGYILPQKLPEIKEERDEDKQAPTPVQQMLTPNLAPNQAAKPDSTPNKT